MTWVVGATSIYGYGALYADVQVTFESGVTRDLVQKSHPISNFIAAGFSGSVRVGFALLQSLADCTKLPDEALETQAWDPVWVATHQWAPAARSVFKAAPYKERDLGASVLLLGASPTENTGLGAKMFLVRFAAPDFKPGIMARFIMSCSIGSGAGVLEVQAQHQAPDSFHEWHSSCRNHEPKRLGSGAGPLYLAGRNRPPTYWHQPTLSRDRSPARRSVNVEQR